MEILIIAGIWITLLYLIRLKMEVSEYRKYFSQHNDIYVPSFKEIAQSNHWSIQLAKYITSQIKEIRIRKRRLSIPIFRKRVQEIATILIEKKPL